MGDEQVDATPYLTHAGLREETAGWGLNALIGERGLNLSGGQRARVTLARALARQAPLLVLDDALSSVDAETESRILDTLGALSASDDDQTLLMITHRFARLHSFDQVLVLEDGVLAQHGTPARVAAGPGLYRKMLELQQMESALGI
ncbi:MAG: ATP-binding cassette domain-containing protein [Deltaproteobacteria bacterium]|nr:ATP-binding cassette domain-containing protein [Deltaproteobacteria bacterium]